MANGAWSNDQLNQILVYDATTGTLILQVDSTGFYYLNVSNGSYFKVTTDATLGSDVAALFQPGKSSVTGVTYNPGEISSGEFVYGVGDVGGEVLILSPQIGSKARASINLTGQSNTSATDDSQINFHAGYLYGNTSNEIGQGTLDESAGSYTSANITSTTEIAADYSIAALGTMSAVRRYAVRWSGTVQSTVAADSIGLRIYSGPNQNNLTGATLLCDYGQIKIATAAVPQPFTVETGFVGVPGKYLLLGARRASGSGTGVLTFNYRHMEDTVHA